MDQGGLEVSLRTNSTWTPMNYKPSREKVFEERLSLIDKWYSGWSKEKRRLFLEHMLMKCTLDQLVLIDAFVHPQLPEPPADFTRLLPRYLSLKIFSFLDPRSLCRATQVCWYWHYLTEENCIWKPKCLRFGWTLPSPPLPTDMGTWKRHYLGCVSSLHWVPPPPTKGKTEEVVMTNEGTNEGRNLPLSVITMAGSRKKPTSRTSKQYKRREGTFTLSRNNNMLQDKPAWRPSDRFPKNLEQSTILTTSWITSKRTRHKSYHRSLSTGSLLHRLSANTSQDDIEEDEQVALQDEESLIDGTLPQHVKHDTFPRPSLLNSNLPDRKNVSRINRSEMYSSLLKRSTTSQDVITLAKAETTQHTLIHKLPHCDDQSLPKDADNTTVQLNTNPWPMKLDYDSSDSDT